MIYKRSFSLLLTITIIFGIMYGISARCETEEAVADTKTHKVEKKYRTDYDTPLSDSLEDYIVETAKDYDIPPEIVLAICWKESNFAIKAKGDSGNSLGLMQIQPRWQKERMKKLGVTNLLNARQNILLGCDILAEILEKYPDMQMALIVYNTGESGAKKYYFSKGVYSNKYSRAVVKKATEYI